MEKQNKNTVPKALKGGQREPGKKEALKNIRIEVNAFGQIVKDFQVEDINQFLDETVPDKKFVTEEGDEPAL